MSSLLLRLCLEGGKRGETTSAFGDEKATTSQDDVDFSRFCGNFE